MTDTIPARVRAIASNLVGKTDDELQIFVDDAIMEVAEVKSLPTSMRERAQRYLAAHLATLDTRRESSRSLGQFSVSYESDKSGGGSMLYATPYGQEYLRIIRKKRMSLETI